MWFALLIFALSGQTLHASGCALDRAIQLHQAGDLAGAVREYEACIAAEPNRVEARSNLGAVLVKLGRYQDADRKSSSRCVRGEILRAPFGNTRRALPPSPTGWRRALTWARCWSNWGAIRM